MKSLLELSVACGLIAAIVAYVLAYDRALLTTSSQRRARQLALQATPGPFIFYLLLGLFISYAVPYLIRR
jgi:hypothetical protein